MEVTLDALIGCVHRRNPGGAPLDQLADAVELSQRLTESADALIGHFVDQARREGASWTAIGESMGVSKQAVQKRFVSEARLARFALRARRAIAASHDEARRLESDHVGNEHLLLGLLTEQEGVAAKALAAQEVTLERARAAVEAAGLPKAGSPPGRLPFAPQTKKVLELALHESLRLDLHHIGTEHILLAILREGEGVAVDVLRRLGVDEQRLRRELA